MGTCCRASMVAASAGIPVSAVKVAWVGDAVSVWAWGAVALWRTTTSAGKAIVFVFSQAKSATAHRPSAGIVKRKRGSIRVRFICPQSTNYPVDCMPQTRLLLFLFSEGKCALNDFVTHFENKKTLIPVGNHQTCQFFRYSYNLSFILQYADKKKSGSTAGIRIDTCR